jgi:hypothetical protein
VIKVATLADASHAGRLKREYEVLCQLRGADVVTALNYAVHPEQGVACLALADQGVSLSVLLASSPGRRLSTESALAAAHAMATALAGLHARGWVHADFKPGNVLCDGKGTIVLSDLEFAACIAAPGREQLPDSLVVGTPPFVAPELWQNGSAALSPASDVWALGVTLYFALFGEYPFSEAPAQAIIAAIYRGPPPHIDILPAPLATLLRSLLAVDTASRLQDGDSAAIAIARTAAQLGIDLPSARAALGRQAAALTDPTPPPEPGTQLAPAPGAGLATPTPRPAPYAPSPAAWTPSVPTRRPPGVGAAEPARGPQRVGAAEPAARPAAGPAWLRETLDIASQADVLHPAPPASVHPPHPHPSTPMAPGPARASSMAAAPQASSAPAAREAAVLTRRAAARWYRRMNPQRNFPLSVVFSGKQIRIVGGRGLGITVGQREIVLDPAHPVLAVEPWFPGCLISPPRADVVVSQETTTCRFWITPLVCGNLSEACVTIRYRDKVVETLATPARVVTRTAAKALAVLGLASPVVSKGLSLAGWDPDEMLRRSMPYLADAVAGMGLMRTGLLITAVLLAGAAGYFYITRPLLSDEPEPALLPQGT